MERVECSGEWWDADTPDIRWPGTYRFDPVEGSVLTVVDSTRPGGFFGTLREYRAVLGRTTDGKDVTLMRCFDRALEGAGPAQREIFANAALIGFHTADPDPPVSGATVLLGYARDWWGQSGITVDRSVQWPSATIHYRRPVERRLATIGDLEVRLCGTLASLPSGPDAAGSLALREEARIELVSKTPRPLNAVLHVVQSCQDLISIACQRYCPVERLIVSEALDPSSQEAEYQAVPIYKAPRQSDTLLGSDFVFRLDDMEAQAPFEAWISSADLLVPVRALYFDAVYGQNFIQGRFLGLTQAIEAFHRRFRGGEYMNSAEFEAKVAAPLVQAIPGDTDRSLRDALRTRIKYGYEYSLRKRLGLLFDEHKQALDCVVPDARAYIEAIVVNRNALTHFPTDADHTPFDAEEWLRYNFILRVLLEWSFLKAMGFTDAKIAQLAERCGEYRSRAERLFGRGGRDRQPLQS